MASSWIFSLLVIFSLFAIGANARPGVHFPCKTILISSFTVSSYKFPNHNPNPNNQIQIQNSPRFFTIFDFYPTQQHHYQEELQLQQQPLEIFLDRRLPSFNSEQQIFLPRSIPFRLQKPDSRQQTLPSFGVTSSLRERTKDILSVVVALLFGVGCGALTSATMYLAWTLITNRCNGVRGDYEDDDSDFSSDYEDVSPKKMGYCKIPDDVPAAVLVDVPAPAPAKEVV